MTLDAEIRLVRDDFALDIELQIAPGTTTALLGPNGAGKSTVVDALSGLLPIDQGHIKLAGRALDDPTGHANDSGKAVFVLPRHRRIGVVFQRYLLFDHLSVAGNIGFGAHTGSAGAWISRLGLEALAHRFPRDLSGGEAQRVALARAFAIEPELLLLDEPLAALDVSTRSATRRTLARHLASYAGPRLLITHDPTDAFLLADQIVVIENGRPTQLGTPDQIRQRPATPWISALAGTNLMRGIISDGSIKLDDHDFVLAAADRTLNGAVLATVHPNAVALHEAQPHGSPRNAWRTTVAAIEPLGDTTRISLGAPLPIMVDITPASTAALGLRVGSPIWASVKATEVGLTPSDD